MADSDQATEDRKQLLEEWKTVIQVQMHFNDMLMKMRTQGLTLVLAFFGAASVALQYNQLYITFFSYSFHASFFIVISGLILLLGVFIMDYFYYYKMLRGAVNRGIEIDKAFKDKKVNGIGLYGLSTEIHKAVSEDKKNRISNAIWEKIGKPPISRVCIEVFYGLVFAFGIIFAAVILFGYHPIAAVGGLTASPTPMPSASPTIMPTATPVQTPIISATPTTTLIP